MASKQWGYFGNRKPCKHLRDLLQYLTVNGLDIWSEHGESPAGWVNVSCGKCLLTYETTLDPNINRSGEHADTEERKARGV